MTLTDAIVLAVYVVGWFVAVRVVRATLTDDPDSFEDGIFMPAACGIFWPLIAGLTVAYFAVKVLIAVATVPLPQLRLPRLGRRSADQERIAELEHALGIDRES